jgi:HK97 family phage major capsid protein
MSATLQAKFQGLLKDAQDLLVEGKLEEARAKRQEAETLKAQIEEWRVVSGLSDFGTSLDPLRPPLPGTTEQAVVEGTVRSTSIVQTETQTTPAVNPTVRAAYVNHLGKPEDEIAQIMVDLHGHDYEKMFWTQKQSFNKYLRYGEVALKAEDHQVLTQIIMTPGAVKTALRQGVGSVETLRTTMVEAADSLGGYSVPIDTQSRIIERSKGMTIVRGRAKQMNTSRDKVELPRMMDNGSDTTDRYTTPVRVRWVDETPSTLEAQNLTFGMTAINLHTSMVEAFFSRNLLEDSAFQLEDKLTEAFGDADGFDEDDQYLFGNGVGRPLGILPAFTNSLGLGEVTTGATASPWFTWNKLLEVPYSIPRQYRQSSAWMFNRHTVLAIRQLRDATTNDYLWTPFQFEGGRDGEETRLLGFPILEQEAFPALANGAYFGLFGSLEGYQIVDRVGMTVERFTDFTLARQNLVGFVMRRRKGGALLEPWRLTALKVAA